LSDSQSKRVRDKRGYVYIEFKGSRRELFRNPYEFPFKPGDLAIVEADSGEDAGTVKHILSQLTQIPYRKPLLSVIRRGSSEDKRRINYHRENEIKAMETCRPKIESHKLSMSIVDAEYQFDSMKLTFFFTSDTRVDFRDLVRDLARSFRTRIDLRQIGSRDEVKRFGGYGVCGMEVCCAHFLKSFYTVSTQMAKNQNLILNPTKLAGLCGRLKCCLKFESDGYSNSEKQGTCKFSQSK